MGKMNFGRYSFNISHEEKIFFPKSKITKGGLINYYNNIAEIMLPHIQDRPVSMLRLPDGIKGESFFQKEASDYFPGWIKTKKIKKQGGSVHHVICNNKATLVYLANQACITPHVWLSKINKLNYPDRLIFDLDPSGENFNFSKVKSSAEIFYKFLSEELKLNTFLMTTGSRGLHVVIPIYANDDFDNVRGFGRNITKIIAERHPKELTIEVRKNKRKGRIFLDTARNGYAQTAVPPYSIRPRENAPVAAPIDWDELSNKKLDSQSYNIKNIFKRLDKIRDPWKDINQNKNSLKKAGKILNDIMKDELR
ncbi:MAG: non-homologous end-joining DNA ligase [Ignavibacteriaceae bacterium]